MYPESPKSIFSSTSAWKYLPQAEVELFNKDARKKLISINVDQDADWNVIRLVDTLDAGARLLNLEMILSLYLYPTLKSRLEALSNNALR